MPNTSQILLLQPPLKRERAFPLSLAYLAALAKELSIDPVGFDADFGEFPKLLAHLHKNESRVKAVFISMLPYQAYDIASMLQRIKALSPSLPAIVFGLYPTLAKEKALQETGADIAILGDAEADFGALMTFLETGKKRPKTIVSRDGKRFLGGKTLAQVENLDALPAPARHLFQPLRYGWAYRSGRYPFMPMLAGLGCNLHCPHCPQPLIEAESVRKRSPESIADEMERLAAEYGVKSFHFEDEHFFSSPEFTEDFAKTLMKRKSGLTWELVNGTRPSSIPLDRLELLYQSGLRRIAIGVEGLYEGDKAPNGLFQPAGYMQKILEQTKKHGILTTGYFMLGMPKISKAVDEQSIRLSLKLGFDMAHYSPYKPYPFCHWSLQQEQNERSQREIKEMSKKAYRKFYLNAKQLGWLAGELTITPRLFHPTVSKILNDIMGQNS